MDVEVEDEEDEDEAADGDEGSEGEPDDGSPIVRTYAPVASANT